ARVRPGCGRVVGLHARAARRADRRSGPTRSRGVRTAAAVDPRPLRRVDARRRARHAADDVARRPHLLPGVGTSHRRRHARGRPRRSPRHRQLPRRRPGRRGPLGRTDTDNTDNTDNTDSRVRGGGAHMTPWMQVRLWYRKASPNQRLGAFSAIGIVISLLVASIAVTPSSSGNHDAAVATAGSGGDSAGGLPGADAGTSGTAGGAESSGAQGASGQTAGGTTLTASDRGVTSKQITIGFMLQNAAGLDKAGFSTGQRGDGTKYITALANWVNKNGGVDGRSIVPVARYTDPTNVDDQAAACRAMTDDAKVFAVDDTASMLDTASLDCLTNLTKGNTPLVHAIEWSTDWAKRSGGNDVSYQAAVDRISITWARDLAAIGWLQPGAVVGILGDKCPATEPTVENVLGPALKAKGAKDVVYGLHDCDIQSVATQPSNIVTQFRLKGVTNVLIVSNFVAGQIFTST